ncbi:hypothetical protein AB0C34_17385 [Nocardia sp. NPDC049220]|uniref:hypothetical protein n=1 Tax=Nocardia sp. NPDC049220 TaxID=3155273 RepID=UPI0033C10B15
MTIAGREKTLDTAGAAVRPRNPRVSPTRRRSPDTATGAASTPGDYAISGRASIEIPITPADLLSLNDRGASKQAALHKAAKVAHLRDTVFTLLKQARLPRGVGFVRVQLHYQPETNRIRDDDNLAATAKPIYDAFTPHRDAKATKKGGKLHVVAARVGYGMVPDDDPAYIDKPPPIIHPVQRGARARLWLEITWGPVKPPTAAQAFTSETLALARLALTGDTTAVRTYLARSADRHRIWYPELTSQLTALLTETASTRSPLRTTTAETACG